METNTASTEKPYFYQSQEVVNTEIDQANPDHVALATYILNNKAFRDDKVVRHLMNKVGLVGSTLDIWVLDRDTTTRMITCHYLRPDTSFFESCLSHLVDPTNAFFDF